MATSILDYIFRELAVSYLGRNDLAHAEPKDMVPDAMGDGSHEGNLPEVDSNAMDAVRKYTSFGYTRNLLVIQGDKNDVATATLKTRKAPVAQAVGAQVTPLDAIPEAAPAYSLSETIMDDTDLYIHRAREARIKGYEGDPCDDCGNMTLVRNGTCLKCNTCGATSGCS